MKELRKNSSAKLLIALFLAVTLPLSIACGYITYCLSGYGVYSADDISETGMLDQLIDFDESVLKNEKLYTDASYSYEFSRQFARVKEDGSGCNVVITVENPDGELVLRNYNSQVDETAVRRLTLSYGRTPGVGIWISSITQGHDSPQKLIPFEDGSGVFVNNVEFSYWLLKEKGIDTLDMSTGEIFNKYGDEYYQEYVEDNGSVTSYTRYSGYYNVTISRAQDSIEFLSRDYLLIKGFELRWAVLICAILMGLISALLLAFLMWSAGWRKDSDGPVCGKAEKIPLGLFVFGAGVLLMAATFGMIAAWKAADIAFINLILHLISVYLFSLAFIGIVVSLTARFKSKDWYRYTLIYGAYRLVEWLRSNISDVLSVMLCCVIWFVLNVVFAVTAINNERLGITLLVVFNLGVIIRIIILAAQWQNIRKAAESIAAGDTDVNVQTKGMPRSLKAHGENVNRISEGVAQAVEKQLTSERMKTDLITNVTHDLKTPLTSIINYVDLLKNQPIENETAQEYINTLDRQAVRLGRLIEDLVEASKITSGNIAVRASKVDIGELIEQAVSEYELRFEQSKLEPVLTIKDDDLAVFADGRLMWRVFDNLLSNACKYALCGSRLYVDAYRDEDNVVVMLRNISASQLNIPADELMERFVRGDSSRTTRGNGLGLSIAKSLVEIQGGMFKLDIDGDLFKASVVLPVYTETDAEQSGEHQPEDI